MTRLNVVFIGGLTNGKVVLDYFLKNRYINVPIIITHPEHLSTPRYVDLSAGIEVGDKFFDLDANRYIDNIRECDPDFIFVAGWSGLLSKDLISIPPRGTIGFHPSKLPFDRGRSTLAWQIEDGYSETALSMFYYSDIPDCGDIIAQERIRIEPNDYIHDVLNKVDESTYNIMHAYFPLLRRGINHRTSQNINDGNFRRLRTERDSLIQWDRNATAIYNKIRAISKPYPGALFKWKDQKIPVWRADIITDASGFETADICLPGSIVKTISPKSHVVRCRDGFLRIETDTPLDLS
jgi:methionyl-tRNA formyltransferase